MPIYRLLKQKEFDPDHCRAMGQAFDNALASLKMDRADPTAELVALKIVEYGQRGERDAGRLRDLAISAFKTPPSH